MKAWVFAHIQLTPEEAASYKNVPVVYDGEYGFFFELNEYVIASYPTWKKQTERANGSTGRHAVIKVCDEFPGFSHFKEHQLFGPASPKLISVP